RNAAFGEFRVLAPELYQSSAARDLRAAHDKLLLMETQAFALASRGESAAAANLLIGDDYDRQKQLSADATAQIARDLSASAESALDFQRQRGRLVVTTVGVAVLLLLFTWVNSLKISAGLVARRRRDEIERSEQARLAAFVGEVR